MEKIIRIMLEALKDISENAGPPTEIAATALRQVEEEASKHERS